jgi:hypothetical protein
MPKETRTTSGVGTPYQRFLLQARPSRTPQYVHGLLSFPLADASRGTVHADLYSNWKCARDGGFIRAKKSDAISASRPLLQIGEDGAWAVRQEE